MTCGTGTNDPSKKTLQRDERIVEMMRRGRPVRAIAQMEGLEADYCRKICKSLAAREGFEYNPAKVTRSDMSFVGLTEASRGFRRYLGDKLHKLGDDPRRVARLVGMTQRCRKYAMERPFNHDWTLTQIERLAAALEMDFADLMREAMNA